MPLATIVTALCGAYIARLRSRERMALIERGQVPDKLPEIAGPAPVLLVLLGGAMLAYLYGQHPELARLAMPRADSAELVEVGPQGRDLCSKASDCGSGCSCDKGRCNCSAAKPGPAPVQRLPPTPRRIAEAGQGTLCADCLALPWHLTEIQVLPIRNPEIP